MRSTGTQSRLANLAKISLTVPTVLRYVSRIFINQRRLTTLGIQIQVSHFVAERSEPYSIGNCQRYWKHRWIMDWDEFATWTEVILVLYQFYCLNISEHSRKFDYDGEELREQTGPAGVVRQKSSTSWFTPALLIFGGIESIKKDWNSQTCPRSKILAVVVLDRFHAWGEEVVIERGKWRLFTIASKSQSRLSKL